MAVTNDEDRMDRYLRMQKIAALLGLPANWLEVEACAGRVPCVRVGIHFFGDYDQVKAAIDKRMARAQRRPKVKA